MPGSVNLSFRNSTYNVSANIKIITRLTSTSSLNMLRYVHKRDHKQFIIHCVGKHGLFTHYLGFAGIKFTEYFIFLKSSLGSGIQLWHGKIMK